MDTNFILFQLETNFLSDFWEYILLLIIIKNDSVWLDILLLY